MKNASLLVVAALVAGCHRSQPTGDDAARETPRPSRSTQVAFDPAFVDIAGSWRSSPGSIAGDHFLQIDVASTGGYVVDVRRRGSSSIEVVETGRGSASVAGRRLSATPRQPVEGVTLKALGAWTADLPSASTGSDRRMRLRGADGRAIELTWSGV